MAIRTSVQRALRAKGSRETNFERLRTALYRQEPDCVPLYEATIEPEVKNAFMGRKLRGIEDDIEFWKTAGYDHYPIRMGLVNFKLQDSAQSLASTLAMTTQRAQTYNIAIGAYSERDWAELHRGIITSKEEFAAFEWPSVDDLDFSLLDNIASLLPSGMKLGVVIGKVFTGVWSMMGMETFFLALHDDPELIELMYSEIAPLQLRILEQAVEHPAVGFTIHADDLASNTGPLVDPAHYRQYVFPVYQKMAEYSRQLDKPLLYHSDGNIWTLLDDLVKCGIHALHPIQPDALDIEAVKAKYGDKLALCGNIDLQYTLTEGAPAEVKAEVRQRIGDLAPGGGYALSSSNSIPEYVPIDNYAAMLEATFTYGCYPISVQLEDVDVAD